MQNAIHNKTPQTNPFDDTSDVFVENVMGKQGALSTNMYH